MRFASQFNNDIVYLLNSFLFNLLGKALTIKNIFDSIMLEINNYNFYEVAYHYGRLVRTLFYFEAIVLGSAFDDLKDDNGLWAIEKYALVLERAQRLVERQEGIREEQIRRQQRKKQREKERREKEERKRASAVLPSEEKGARARLVLAEFKRVERISLELQALMMEVNAGKRTFAVPPIDLKTDIALFLLELINGAFGTFPYTSMAYYCKTNTTSI